MKITRTTVKTYDIACGCSSETWNITFGSFRNTRVKNNQSVKQFETCFICGHRFEDDEVPAVVQVSTNGNRFSCDDCYEKLESEVSE